MGVPVTARTDERGRGLTTTRVFHVDLSYQSVPFYDPESGVYRYRVNKPRDPLENRRNFNWDVRLDLFAIRLITGDKREI